MHQIVVPAAATALALGLLVLTPPPPPPTREGFASGSGDGVWPPDTVLPPDAIHGTAPRPDDAGPRPMGSIFVSIAAYRDRECNATLKSLFENADHPELIYPGVVEQNTNDDLESCASKDRLPERFQRNVTLMSVPHTEARGPTYARYLCSTLFNGEQFMLQIDSHTLASKGWDTKLKNAYDKALTKSRKPILSTYPMAHDSAETGTPTLCKSSFNSDGIPTWEAIIMTGDEKDDIRPVPFTSGGFLFSSGKLFAEVPYDKNLNYLFQGEEALYSARAWTSGYDIFTPPAGILTHFYTRKGSPRFWDDGAHSGYKESQAKTLTFVRRLLGMQGPQVPDDYPFGLGKVRSLDAWYDFAGLDRHNKSSNSFQKFCGQRPATVPAST